VFLGSLQGEALAAAYAAADVFVFPSRTDTFGLVLLEALASGLPVAAFPVMGPARCQSAMRPWRVLSEDLRSACLSGASHFTTSLCGICRPPHLGGRGARLYRQYGPNRAPFRRKPSRWISFPRSRPRCWKSSRACRPVTGRDTTPAWQHHRKSSPCKSSPSVPRTSTPPRAWWRRSPCGRRFLSPPVLNERIGTKSVPEAGNAAANRLLQVSRRLQQIVVDPAKRAGRRRGRVSSGNHAQGVAAAAKSSTCRPPS